MNTLPEPLRACLAAGADAADRLTEWPEASWAALRESGLLAWAVPSEYGGRSADAVALLERGEVLAAACVTTAFILSQREAAVRLLTRGPAHLQHRYLPVLASGTAYLTVGLSQLTTSRQHQQPALRASVCGVDGYRLDGEIPWVTGADRAVALVVGATLIDGRQMIFVVPTDRPGITIDPPMALAALLGSRTTVVRCTDVSLTAEDLLMGPTEQVLGKVGGGGLETSALALGLARTAAEYLHHEARSRPGLSEIADRFTATLDATRSRLHLQATTADSDATMAIRVDCTRLALTATQAALLSAKGTGFVIPHPAQRWFRQAGFFLVWSCPRPVATGVLASLVPEEILSE